MHDDFEYYSRRVEQEDAAAIRSHQPAAVLAHRSLSLLYKDRVAALVRDGSEPRDAGPKLAICV